ncbi:hypothetical protein [Aminobacter sp. MSH1]|uniref:hypothetical protein n=1 Tax=Aminobacter sp. MSH1 TaxID=374606 RepID=UPI00131F1105|nr:hypothetical protein [Aminobacter sp. MSH1]
MSLSWKLAPALALCLSATTVGGCSRSSDGTVIIPKPMDSRRFWQDDDARRAASEGSQAASFPAGPEIRFVTQQPGPRPVTRAPRRASESAAGSAKPMSCRAITGPTGRVRYACE